MREKWFCIFYILQSLTTMRTPGRAMQAMKATLVSIGQRRGTGYLASVLGIAAVIAVCVAFRDQLSNTTVALALVLVVLFIATLWRRGPGIVASVLGMLGFNFFFLPPFYTLTIADPENWVALAAFFITASTAGHLSVTVKRRAAEAEAGRKAARLASLYNRSLLEASLDPLVTIGPDGEIADVNAATEMVTGPYTSGTHRHRFLRVLHRAREGPGRVSAGVS